MVSRLRLISGLILFLFVLSHFYTHTLGLVSLGKMNNGLFHTVVYWRTVPGTLLFMPALLVHVVLTSYGLLQKRSFRLSRTDWVQIVTGLLIPVLLGAHIIATRGAYEVFGLEEGYKFQLYIHWVAAPIYGIMVTSAIFVVWIHACIGWHNWFKYNRVYNAIKLYLLGLAILVPTLAFAGIVTNGFRVTRLARNEKWVANVTKKVSEIGQPYQDFVLDNERIINLGVVGFIAAVALVYLARKLLARFSGKNSISYTTLHSDTSKKLKPQRGATLLDTIREAGIEHASVCGGRGRCSTCRVLVGQGGEALAEPNGTEAKVLAKLQAGPNVRLACQVVPGGPMLVTALLDPKTAGARASENSRHDNGEEQEIAILFADIRSFTKLSEGQLPYDTAFMLNRYFAAMGQAIESEGGHLDKFIGDGVMALFGIDATPQQACETALKAAIAMSERLEQLNTMLVNDIGEEIRIGIGIHFGTAIVGNMGYGHATGLTAIGDAVNTASRIEGLTKEHGVQLIVSEDVAKHSGLDFSSFETHQTEIRGRVEPLDIYTIKSGLDLRQAEAITA